MEVYKNVRIMRLKGGASETVEDPVAVEKRLNVSINGRKVMSLYCTPLMLRELVTGLIHNEGLISGEWCADRMRIEYGEEILVDLPSSGTVNAGEQTLTSGCAGGISTMRAMPGKALRDAVTFSAGLVRALFRNFQQRSELYRLTGGIHSAALSEGTGISAFAEDIGRHNAVDKVIGYCLLENIPFQGSLMMVSGRLSSDIVHKCYACRIPVLVSRASPTSLAVDIAGKAGITLVGFLRGERMNVYTSAQRIVLEGKNLVPENDDLETDRGHGYQ